MPAPARKTAARYRWWQHACRAAVLVALALGGAYVTLPWWVPASYLRDRIAADLSAQMKVPVTIHEMSFSWSRGVEIRHLRIYPEKRFGSEPLVDVPEIRADFSPIDYVLRKRLAWLEVREPRVTLTFDQDGNASLAPLTRMSSDLEIDRISVHRAVAIVRFPACREGLRLNVSDLQYVAGRLSKFGRMTMSADLHQSGSLAPVGLQVAAIPRDEVVAAAAAFNFSNVDLQQLPLIQLLGLPLRRLAGRCSGSLKLRLTHEGVVDQFGLDVIMRLLDVQPLTGRRLRVIEEAGFRVLARYDLFPGPDAALTIQSAHVRLPGLELSGHADLFLGSGLGWDAIKSLHLEGWVQPEQLVPVFTGRRPLPWGIRVGRPIALKLDAGQEAQDSSAPPRHPPLPMHLELDASEAAIAQAGRTIKPANTRLLAELRATLDRGDWSFTVHHGRIALGGNEFRGSGGIRDLRARLDQWSRPDYVWTLQSALDALRETKWEGSWEINELASLGWLVPLPPDMTFRGRLSGGWSLDPRRRRLIEIDFSVPKDAELAVGKAFLKPAGKAMTMVLGANLDARRPGLSDLWADLHVGAGRASLSGGAVQFLPGRQEQAGDMAVELLGRFDAERIEDILACLGPWHDAPPAPQAPEANGPHEAPKITGAFDGEFWCRLAPGVQIGRLTADLTNLDVLWPDKLRKPAKEDARLEVGFLGDVALAGDRLTARVRCPAGVVELDAGLRPHAGPAGRASFEARADVRDAGWLLRALPALRRELHAQKLDGCLALNASGTWEPQQAALDLHFDGTDLEYASDTTPRRVKGRGVPLTAWLRGRGYRSEDGCLHTSIRSAGASLGDSRVDLSGAAVYQPAANERAARLYPPGNLRSFEAGVEFALAADGAVLGLVPELNAPAAKHALAGTVIGVARVGGDRESAWLKAAVDATNLGAEALGPFVFEPQPPANGRAPGAAPAGAPASAPANGGTRPDTQQTRLGPVLIVTSGQGEAEAIRRIVAGPFVKPAGVKATANIELSYEDRPSRLVLRDLSVHVGGLEVLASGSAPVSHDSRRPPVDPDRTSCHVAVRIARAEDLARLAPSMKPGDLSGGMLLEAEWRDGNPDRLDYVSLRATKFQARYSGRQVAMDGGLVLGQVRRTQDARLEVGSFRTDGLSFATGASRGWLVADVQGLPDRPKGTFTFSAAVLDDRDLSALSGAEGGQGPTTQPATMTDSQIAALAKRAQEIVRRITPPALGADLHGRVRIGTLRALDVSVGEAYTMRDLVADVSVDHGRVKIECDAGVNGGTMRREFKVDLNDSAPMVASHSELLEVQASKEFQPQLAKYFPGNTFSGTFTRTEDVQIALGNLVANVMDTRYPPRPVGTAVSVTTDGIVKGRAAPEWMTSIFPGLKLTEYRYNKMTSFNQYLANGSAKNEMVFDGKTYDLHIDGTTDAKNFGRYTLGLLLIGSAPTGKGPEAPKPVTVPLLTMTARIEGGQMLDQQIQYFSPEVITKILIDNNISIVTGIISGAYRAFLLARKALTFGTDTK